MKTLILGIGNDILKDDGIGPRLVCDLSQKNIIRDVSFKVASCGGLEIMDNIEGFERVIIIDAICDLYGKPGEISYFTPEDFRETSHLSSLHDISFLTALMLGRRLELNLPADLHIIAVSIIEDKEFGEELTSALREEYPRILHEVQSIVENITENKNT